MARQLKLDDREWIEIINSKDEVTGGFWWNPSDLDIVKRCEKVMDFFNHLEVEDRSKTDSLFLLSDAVKQQFEYLIPGSAEDLFKYSNPLSPMGDGTLYAEYVLTQLIQFMEAELDVRMEKTTTRIQKYTDGYDK